METRRHWCSKSAYCSPPSSQPRVMLWTTPQSTSTILTKCLSAAVPNPQRIVKTRSARGVYDGAVVKDGPADDIDDEPSDELLQQAAETMCSEDCSGGRVCTDMLRFRHIKRLLENPNSSKRFVFCKDFGHSIVDRYEFLPDRTAQYRHAFLIRHPAKMFRSRRKVLLAEYESSRGGAKKTYQAAKSREEFHLLKDAPSWYNPPGLCYKELYELTAYVRENVDPHLVILDSDDLLSNPAVVLPKFCDALGIPYSERLLSWSPDPVATDEWQNAFSPIRSFEFINMFCHTAFESSQFFSPGPVPGDNDLTDDVKECVEYCLPFYKEMHQMRLC
ncbi:uncharacterized protein [Diadema setosum]|uniref:uncharacterized protein n=1 Tax=Diadema setosum TaxID=31175 RepID=UPI003B3B7D22